MRSTKRHREVTAVGYGGKGREGSGQAARDLGQPTVGG